MTTRNFVPRNNNEGQLGTENKKWNKIYTNEIFATNFTGNLTGTADNATNATNATNADVSKKVSNTATNGSGIDLVTGTMANNDYFRIRIGGSDDVGYAEIATADNGNDPIYIRQYGEGNWGFSNLIRTATILDSRGNTSFPGTVTAPNFNGKATKAIQDSDGNTITTHYLSRARGDIPSKNFDNAYTEGLYNFGNYETNRPCDYGRLLTLNNGYNSTGSWIWQLALPTRNNNLRLRTRTNGEAWLGWRTIPFTDSPAFSGSPTAPTPSTSDNGTRIATTAFVQSLISSLKGSIGGTISAASLNENGYVKFSNGFIVQWGRVHLTDSNWEGEVGPFNFPISFSSSCFFVLPSMGNSDGGNPQSYDSSVQQRRWNNSQFWLYQQIMGGRPWFAFAHYIAFGR